MVRKGVSFINPAIIGETCRDKIKSHCKNRLHFPLVEFLNWDDVEKIQNLGHEIGSHTMEHINVAQASKEEFIEDCKITFEILQSRCGEAKHFAFPYGRFFHFNEAGRNVVFDAGFTSCATAERGCHINHNGFIRNDELCILRDHILLEWDIDHIIHFLTTNSKAATAKNNLFPYTSI